MIAPSAYESPAYHAEAALLYAWTAEADLAYAIEGEGKKSRALNPSFKPAIGFKFELGAPLPHDKWDIALRLTHLHSRASVHQEGAELTPLWSLSQTNPTGFVDEARGHWRLHFGMVDLELGNTFLAGPTLAIRPFLGLRYAIIRQKYLLSYFGGALFPGAKDYLSMKNKFLAPGVCTGVDIDWKIKGSWSLYSHAGFSIQVGQVYVHEIEQLSTEKFKRGNIYDRFYMAKPIVDWAVGIQWETPSFGRKREERFLFRAGWEQYLFFAQNQFFHFLSSGRRPFTLNHESLSIQALSLSATFLF
ncbi:MAG: hypothetical protein HYX48_02395 [Chlamydiales bacterium]|nr:hypothetical protein [Chlamydiales bacterium]